MILGEQFLVIDDLSKGLNVYEGDTNVSKGFYVDATNMVLTTKNPKTIAGLTALNTALVDIEQPILWFEPYSGHDVTGKIVTAFGDGSLWNYDIEADSWTRLYQGLWPGEDVLWNSVPFRGDLIMANGIDPIIKYDGTSVTFVGTISVARFETDETWTGTGTIITDPLFVVQGEQAMSIAAGASATTTFAESMDLSSGIGGGPVFDEDDQFSFRLYKVPGSSDGSYSVQFQTSSGNTFDLVVAVTAADDGFTIPVIARGDFGETGTPDWADINTINLSVSGTDQAMVFDDLYIGYNQRPPVGKFVEMYNQQLVVAGIPDSLTEIRYSDPGTIDYFPVDNFAFFSGGRHQMEKEDQITALHTYFDELIVGKVNSAWTFSGSGENVAISALPLTIGVDSHRAMVETPWALHFPFENNIFGARLTSRGIVSQNINPLLADMDGDETQRTVAIRHDRSHTVRWSWRNIGDGFTAPTLEVEPRPQQQRGLIYDHLIDAWASRYLPNIHWYSRAIVDGNRELLAARGDGHFWRVDVGEDFGVLGDDEVETEITSSVRLPWVQSPAADHKGNVSRWTNATVYLRGLPVGGTEISIRARFADYPTEFNNTSFVTYGTVNASPDGDKGFVFFGKTSRWMQLEFSAEAYGFELLMPLSIGFLDTGRRV